MSIPDVEGPIIYPRGLFENDDLKKRTFVVEKLTLVDLAFTVPGDIVDGGDTCYNYARVLCHYGGLIIELGDGWAESEGERVLHWCFPQFQAAGHTKYS